MATLTVTHTEDLTLNGVQQGTTNTLTISSIGSVLKRIVTIPSGVDTTVLEFHTNVTADNQAGPVTALGGVLDREETQYIRITNRDSNTAHVCAVNLIGDSTDDDDDDDAADGVVALGLAVGHSLVLGGPVVDLMSLTDANTNVIAESSLTNLSRVVIEGGSNDVDIEIFVAGT